MVARASATLRESEPPPRSSAMKGITTPLSARAVKVGTGRPKPVGFLKLDEWSRGMTIPSFQYFLIPLLIRSMVAGASGRRRSPIRSPFWVQSITVAAARM